MGGAGSVAPDWLRVSSMAVIALPGNAYGAAKLIRRRHRATLASRCTSTLGRTAALEPGRAAGLAPGNRPAPGAYQLNCIA